MIISKEQGIMIIAALAGGLIIGFGLWGGNKIPNEAVIANIRESNKMLMDKVHEGSKDLEKLSFQILYLRKELEKNISTISDSVALNENAIADITGEVQSLKKKTTRSTKSKSALKKPSRKAKQAEKTKKVDSSSQPPQVLPVGSVDTINYLEFDYGSVTITKENSEQLDQLIASLYDKNDLKIEITGYIDMEKDKEALRRNHFNNKLKTQKLIEMKKSGAPIVPLDEVLIEQDEYESYLKKVYKAEKFRKPTYILGIPKKLPAREMETLIIAHIAITNDELKSFASKRALMVSDYMLTSNKINQERLFLNEASSLSPETTKDGKNSVVIVKVTPLSQKD